MLTVMSVYIVLKLVSKCMFLKKIKTMEYSPCGNKIYIYDNQNTIKLYDAKNFTLLKVISRDKILNSKYNRTNMIIIKKNNFSPLISDIEKIIG